jgi:hypothetical protein
MTDKILSRRLALQAAATTGVGLLAGCATASPDAAPARAPMRFDDPKWNRDTVAKLEADVAPGKQVYGWCSGVVNGVRDGEKLRPLMRFEVFSSIRIVRQPDGNYERLCRELVFYRDIVTNQLMEQWDNPYTGERVRVVDIANDPFNYRVSDFFPEPPSYGGLNKERPPKRPFLLKWTRISNDVVSLETDIHLNYPSALKPEKWPRESAGPMNRVSEMFRYFIRREDLENPALTNIPYSGVWTRVTPWLPWMLMDQTPGHILYVGDMSSRRNLDLYEPDVIARVKERYPTYLTAPQAWSEPSLSSLEHYALEQQPAPPRAKK